MLSNTSALILLLFLIVALHEFWYKKKIYILGSDGILNRYIMFGRGICEKYQSRDEKFPEPNGEGNLVSRLVFSANTPPEPDISV